MKNFLLILVASLLMACSTVPTQAPTPFETGATIQAPQGCVELRAKDPKADC
jgi:hypothetical protein